MGIMKKNTVIAINYNHLKSIAIFSDKVWEEKANHNLILNNTFGVSFQK